RSSQELDEAGDNPVNAIVSVLMLREGWDVPNVTAVVGLRPYTAKANILPEQTIGRGTACRIPTLRCGRTWPHQGHQAGPQYGLESRPTLGWAGSPLRRHSRTLGQMRVSARAA